MGFLSFNSTYYRVILIYVSSLLRDRQLHNIMYQCLHMGIRSGARVEGFPRRLSCCLRWQCLMLPYNYNDRNNYMTLKTESGAEWHQKV